MKTALIFAGGGSLSAIRLGASRLFVLPTGHAADRCLFRLADCKAAGTLEAAVTEPDLTRPLQNNTKESSS
jgi:hypothetical protein